MKRLALIVALCVIASTFFGCARSVTMQNPQPANRTQVAAYTPEDIDRAVQAWMDDIMKFGPVATSPEPPLVGFCGIKNMGREHIEMQEFERAFKYFGIRTGKIRFTSATDLPDNFFEQHKFQKSVVADKATAVQIGKILGWKYSIYGELYSKVEPDARGNRIMYYEVYVYMLNIETGEEVWNSRDKFALNNLKGRVGW